MILAANMPGLAELSFRGWFPPWLAVLLATGAVLATIVLYRREAGRLPVAMRVIMAGLRCLVLAFVALLLLRPSLVYDRTQEVPRAVALLLDDSQSMQSRDPRSNFADQYRAAIAFGLVPHDSRIPANPSASDLPEGLPDRPSRLDIMRKLLEHPKLMLFDRLERVGPVQPSTFGTRRLSRDPRDRAWLDSLTGEEQRTALADAAFDLLRRDDVDLPAAIVIFTDGRENASERSMTDLARECARREVPLFAVGIGSSSFSQLQLLDAPAPETLFVDDTVSVPVRYRLRGAAGGRVQITLALNGREVAKRIVDAVEGDDLKETLSFVPTKEQAEAGRQDFTATVQVFHGVDTLTDAMSRGVRVVDQKLKVLVVDTVPRWDFKFLQRALLRDRRVEASFFLIDGDPRALKSGPPFIAAFPATRAELFAYDLLILGDVSAANFTREQQEMIREFVVEGGGFIQVAGRQRGPASFVGTPLADLLPVEIDAVRPPAETDVPKAFRPRLAPAGVRSPLLRLEDDPAASLRIWAMLPELYWHYPVRKLKPAAEVLLAHPDAVLPGGEPMPLLAAHYYGKGYSIFAAFDESWRWRYNEADAYFARFWSQLVYVAGVPRTLGSKLTQLALDTPDPQLGRTGTLYARLYTPEMRPVTAERLSARLEHLDAAAAEADRIQMIDLRALPGQPGEYVAAVPFDRTGRFRIRVDNGSDTGTLEYRVHLPPDHELAPGGLAEEELRRLAAATGGQFYREESVHRLPDDLPRKTITQTRREEVLLWYRWAMLAVIALLAAEWVLRKFWSLS